MNISTFDDKSFDKKKYEVQLYIKNNISRKIYQKKLRKLAAQEVVIIKNIFTNEDDFKIDPKLLLNELLEFRS
jgi:hypothetical protein